MQPSRTALATEPAPGEVSSLPDLARLEAVPLIREPFDFVMVEDFVPAALRAGLLADFPPITQGGSFPLAHLSPGPRFAAFAAALQGPAVAAAFSAKFGLDLGERPTMVTLRGQAREKDGRIHTDSSSKLLTTLIYFNDSWSADGGALRMLRSPDDIEDYALEVPPRAGTLIAFRCAPNAYHGHKPFVGERRSLQLNWMRDESVLRRELKRHGVSAMVKQITGIFRGKS